MRAARFLNPSAPAAAFLRRRCLSTAAPLPSAASVPSAAWHSPADASHGVADEARPIVVLIGWVGSTHKQLGHYSRLYSNTPHAADVLQIETSPQHVLFPSQSLAIGSAVTDLLSTGSLRRRPIVLGGFSGGAYAVGNVLKAMEGDAAGAAVAARVVAGVYDSAVDWEGVPFGLSSAVFGPHTPAQAMAERAIRAYLRAVPDTSALYQSSSDRFHRMALPHKSDTLIVYSNDGEFFGGGRPSCLSAAAPSDSAPLYSALLRSVRFAPLTPPPSPDPIASPAICKALAEEWREQGQDVDEYVLEASKHVMHLKTEPEEYRRRVAGLLDRAMAAWLGGEAQVKAAAA